MVEDIGRIGSALETAVSKAIAGARRVGVLFSGGLDSSVLATIAKKYNPSVTLYVAGIEESTDLKTARASAEKLSIPLVEIILNDEMIRKLLEKTKEITGEKELMKLELGLILLAACAKAREDGVELLLSGLGAEELFLGYRMHSQRFAAGEDMEALRRSELEGLYEKDIRRSEKIASYCKVTLVLPYLDGDVVKAALSIPAKENFRGVENKAVLRNLARKMGLPESICAKKKKAMQYGSGVHARLLKMMRTKAKLI